MSTFDPYKNDHQSMQIGELIFENQTDKVIVYGDIDIKKTSDGLEQALKLQKVFNDIVNYLQNNADELSSNPISKVGQNSDNGDTEDTSSKKIDNPFS